MSSKVLSQYFLVSKTQLAKMAQYIQVHGSRRLLEIGPGKGQLTEFLLAKNVPIDCVELDSNLCDQLKEKFSAYPQVNIICQDFLSYPLGEMHQVIVGNIPYHLSFAILEKLLSQTKYITKAYFTLQKEFAQKLVAQEGTKSFGFLTCRVRLYADVRILFSIRRTNFRPIPRVDSVFCQFTFLAQPRYSVRDPEKLFSFLRMLFSQRRKKIHTILRGFYPRHNIEALLRAVSIDKDLRPEKVSLRSLVQLSNLLT